MKVNPKRVLRRIVRFEDSDYLTRRGNPQNYRIVLECGHYFTRYFSRSLMVRHKIFQNLPDNVQRCDCRDCKQNLPIDILHMQVGDLRCLEPYIPDIREQWSNAVQAKLPPLPKKS